jgi:hypothetical protein
VEKGDGSTETVEVLLRPYLDPEAGGLSWRPLEAEHGMRCVCVCAFFGGGGMLGKNVQWTGDRPPPLPPFNNPPKQYTTHNIHNTNTAAGPTPSASCNSGAGTHPC